MVKTNGVEGGYFYIQWLGSTASCSECGTELSDGPVGVINTPPKKGPICDTCFIHLDLDLGSILWLVNFTREAARSLALATPEEQQLDMSLLMLFAMLFDQHAGFKRRKSNALPLMFELMESGRPSTLAQMARKLAPTAGNIH